MRKDIPPKKFLEILSLFSQLEFQEKGKGLQKLNWSRDVTGTINIIQSFFPESSG